MRITPEPSGHCEKVQARWREEVGKKAILSDLEALEEAGFELEITEGKFRQKMYSYPHRTFEPYELLMLIDAVCFPISSRPKMRTA
jgi:hypothetical protein